MPPPLDPPVPPDEFESPVLEPPESAESLPESEESESDDGEPAGEEPDPLEEAEEELPEEPEDPPGTSRKSSQIQPEFPPARTWYQPPCRPRISTPVPPATVRVTPWLMPAPDRMLTPEVVRASDEEDCCDEPVEPDDESEDPSELGALPDPEELDELEESEEFEEPEPLDDEELVSEEEPPAR